MPEAININEMLTNKKSSCTIFDNEKMSLRAGALCPSSINMSTHIYVLISADEAYQAKISIIIL